MSSNLSSVPTCYVFTQVITDVNACLCEIQCASRILRCLDLVAFAEEEQRGKRG
jgi:hypothetical protein